MFVYERNSNPKSDSVDLRDKALPDVDLWGHSCCDANAELRWRLGILIIQEK